MNIKINLSVSKKDMEAFKSMRFPNGLLLNPMTNMYHKDGEPAPQFFQRLPYLLNVGFIRAFTAANGSSIKRESYCLTRTGQDVYHQLKTNNIIL